MSTRGRQESDALGDEILTGFTETDTFETFANADVDVFLI